MWLSGLLWAVGCRDQVVWASAVGVEVVVLVIAVVKEIQQRTIVLLRVLPFLNPKHSTLNLEPERLGAPKTDQQDK